MKYVHRNFIMEEWVTDVKVFIGTNLGECMQHLEKWVSSDEGCWRLMSHTVTKGFQETNGEFRWVVTGVKQSRYERDD